MIFPAIRSSKLNPLSFAVEQLTEEILSVIDSSVILSLGTHEILHCSQSIKGLLGISAEEVMEKGWPFLFNQVHPSDQKLIRHKILPIQSIFLGSEGTDPSGEFSLAFTCRMKHAESHYLLIALETKMLVTEGDSRAYLTVLRDISAYGDRSKMECVVHEYSNGTEDKRILKHEFDFIYPPFTRTEVRIIRLLAQGQDSKSIASTLCISPQTVRTHRKSILSKSGTSSVTQLITLAGQMSIL